MSRDLIYLIGPPGAGKTSALRSALVGYSRRADQVAGCPIIRLKRGSLSRPGLPDEMIELGKDRDAFSGTDALSMGIQPAAVKAMSEMTGVVLSEGDRLANQKFLGACEDNGWRVHLVYLATPLTVCAQRRSERGSHQNPAWVQGRVTKSRALAEKWGATLLAGDGDGDAVGDRLARLIAAIVD